MPKRNIPASAHMTENIEALMSAINSHIRANMFNLFYSTVTDLARLRGWSTSVPLRSAT